MMHSPLTSSNLHFRPFIPSISATSTLTFISANSLFARSRVLPMLSGDNSVQEAGLNEKILLNHDLLGEMVDPGEIDDPAELGPDRFGENGVGSTDKSAL
jgi:hypothetical protein